LLRSVELVADPPCLQALGEVELTLDDPAGARRWLERGLALAAPPEVDLLLDLSQADRQLGSVESAIEHARRALTLDPDEPKAWLALGASLAAAQRWDPAVRAFERGIALSPDADLRDRLQMGRIDTLLRCHREADALAALTARPGGDARADGRAAHYRAVALDRLGRRPEAMAALREAAAAPDPPSTVIRQIGMAEAEDARRLSWLGFWFGPASSRSRRVVGTILVAVAALLAGVAMIDPDDVDGLGWRAEGAVSLVPLAVVLGLFLLPLATTMKVGAFEITLPAPAAIETGDIAMPDLGRLLDHVAAIGLGGVAVSLRSPGWSASPTSLRSPSGPDLTVPASATAWTVTGTPTR
jgi:hypothetical protein